MVELDLVNKAKQHLFEMVGEILGNGPSVYIIAKLN